MKQNKKSKRVHTYCSNTNAGFVPVLVPVILILIILIVMSVVGWSEYSKQQNRDDRAVEMAESSRAETHPERAVQL